ncbi:MAG: DUF5926 family protein [Jiangellales bacterium]
MAKKHRGPRPVVEVEVEVVGPREPCPCGSGKRYKVCHGKAAARARAPMVERPFEGLPSETDWVALREFVPAATASVQLRPDATQAPPVSVVTVLPTALPAMRRDDGEVLVALQTTTSSGDPSRDVAAALLAALALDAGGAVAMPGLPGPGPRLQDVLDPDGGFDVVMHETFDFWVGDAADDPSTKALLEQANTSIIPTERLASVSSAYAATMGERRYLRWVQPYAEDRLLDALARLRAAGADGLGDATTMLGTFRAHGLLVPVWELGEDVLLGDLEDPAVALADRLADEVQNASPLDADQRRARAALANRQITIR